MKEHKHYFEYHRALYSTNAQMRKHLNARATARYSKVDCA